MTRKSNIAPRSLQEKAYAYLRAKILSGELVPGEQISEVSIARELGTSRGPLREAVRRLAAEGLLHQAPAGGSRVAEFSRRDVAEIYELREALEVYAAGKAAEHGLRPAELDGLEQLVREILSLRDELKKARKHHLNRDQMKRFVRADFQFHNTIVRGAANARIMKAVADTRVLINVFGIRRNGHDLDLLTEIHGYHAGILAAISRRDPGEAMRLAGEHIRLSKHERLKEYDEREREAVMNAHASIAV